MNTKSALWIPIAREISLWTSILVQSNIVITGTGVKLLGAIPTQLLLSDYDDLRLPYYNSCFYSQCLIMIGDGYAMKTALHNNVPFFHAYQSADV